MILSRLHQQPLRMKQTLPLFWLFSVSLLWQTIVNAAPVFVASEIPRSNLEDRIYLADMNGDGNSDVLLAHWSEQQGRELYIHLQQPDGRYPALPSRKVEIKPEIIAFATADLRPEPGDELVFLSSDAAYSFSSAINTYSGNLKQLVEWPLIASTPERKSIAWLGELPDIDKDGFADLLLPDDEGFGYFRGQGEERFEFVGKLITVSGDLVSMERRNRAARGSVRLNFNDEGGFEFSLNSPSSSEFVRFLTEWSADLAEGAGLLGQQDWIPPLSLATVNDDKLLDLLYINEDDEEERQLSLLLQNPSGGFASEPVWQSEIDPRSSWQLEELTGDGLADLVRLSIQGNESTAYFYRNNAGNFDLERPDQVLRFSGLGLFVDFSDLNGDSKPELGVSYFSIPLLDALRDVSIQRTRMIFTNVAQQTATTGEEPALLFSRRADYKYDETISAESVLGLTSFGNLEVDLDGDSKKDYLQIAGDGTLTAKSIDPTTLQFATQPFWQYVPSRIVVNFTPEDLNADDRPDLILHHSLHFTVLVSVE